MTCPEYLTTGLEATFDRIHRERMKDVPILNKALRIQAVGFSNWQGDCLGVLITPWFMNLMLLPHKGGKWDDLPTGTKINHAFPSGNYEFIAGKEEGIGSYQMCSLFSPVFEFQDQEAAVATAEAVLEGMTDEANRGSVSTREREIQKIWNGEDVDTTDEAMAVAEREDDKRLTLQERIKKPISRRDLLRGAILRREE